LLPLPGQPLRLACTSINHVNKERMVSFDGNAYSVPLNPGNPRLSVVGQSLRAPDRHQLPGQGRGRTRPLLRQKARRSWIRCTTWTCSKRARAPSSMPSRSATLALRSGRRSTSVIWPSCASGWRTNQAVPALRASAAAARRVPGRDIERASGARLDAECFSVDGVRHLLLVRTIRRRQG